MAKLKMYCNSRQKKKFISYLILKEECPWTDSEYDLEHMIAMEKYARLEVSSFRKYLSKIFNESQSFDKPVKQKLRRMLLDSGSAAFMDRAQRIRIFRAAIEEKKDDEVARLLRLKKQRRSIG